MDHRLGALRLRLAHCLRERIGAVVAVRDDADLHSIRSMPPKTRTKRTELSQRL